MGYNLFQRGDEPVRPDFERTVLSVPAPDSLVPEGPVDAASQPPSSLPAGADELDAPAAEPTLAHIGRYALKHQIGQGGLGTVHEAWDPLLSRTVAVKTLQFDIDTPSRVSLDGLFLNEARTAAGLNHPCIVTIFDAGLSAHGVYIAMERLRGRDLRQALNEGWKPTPAESAQLVRRITDALAYAHARGVVHCDIKPANIFLTRRDKPKVLDFGIARAAHGSALPSLDGLIIGSPHYLSPEQLQGGAVDARSDLYALGVVLYELLTGRKAFDGATLAAIHHAVLHDTPPPAHELRGDVPAPLSAIAARAMQRDPGERYANALEMSQDLRRWADAAPVAETAGADAAPGATSRRLWLAGSAVALIGGIGLFAWPRQGAAPPAPAVAAAAPAAAPATAVAAAQPDVAVPPLPEPATTTPAAPPATAGAAAPAARSTTATRPGTTRPAAVRPRPAATAAVEAAATGVPADAAPATGSVQFAISPWGQIEVDGRPAGTTPPLSRLTLPEGAHTITVRNEDFPPLTVQVQVGADRPLTVRHRFGS